MNRKFCLICGLIVLGRISIQAEPGTKKWSFVTGGYISTAPAVDHNGTIYIGCDDYKLYALNPDGIKEWEFVATGPIASNPTIDSNGTVYIGTANYQNPSENEFYAINPNGSEKWSLPVPDIITASPAIGQDGTIYMGCGDNRLYAINPEGSISWSFNTGDPVNSSPAVDSNGNIYICSEEKLFVVNPEGTLKWSYLTNGSLPTSPALGGHGMIYLGSRDDHLHALNSNGRSDWTWKMNDNAYSPIVDSDGTIYVGSEDSYLYALNPDGTEKWRFPVNDWMSTPVIGKDGLLYLGIYYDYIGEPNNRLLALDHEGIEQWVFPTENGVRYSPAIGPDGTIYFASSEDKTLYAIESSSLGLADSPWPKIQKDNQNTGLYADAVTLIHNPLQQKKIQHPEAFILYQNAPNPFNPVTLISFELPQQSHVSISIYNLNGKQVDSIHNVFEAGFHSMIWNASALRSGTYFIHMHAGGRQLIKKCMLLK